MAAHRYDTGQLCRRRNINRKLYLNVFNFFFNGSLNDLRTTRTEFVNFKRKMHVK